MIAVANTSREATLTGAPAGLVGTLTFRVIDPPANTIIVAESTTGITEPAAGTYSRTFAAPAQAGQYLIVWRNGTVESTEELEVLQGSPTGVDLCTLAQVREFLQKPLADTEQDAVIGAIITRASHLIMDEAGREFAPASPSSERVLTYHGGGVLSLDPGDAREITQVRLDPDTATPTVLDPADWRVPPLRDGVTSSIELAATVDPEGSGWPTRTIGVTATWGFPVVPGAVQHACILTVAEHLRRNVQAFSTVFRLDEGIVERPMSIPSAARFAIDPYRRMDMFP